VRAGGGHGPQSATAQPEDGDLLAWDRLGVGDVGQREGQATVDPESPIAGRCR
jgi:hypothetical protein